MPNLQYLWSKLCKKVRGSAVLSSVIAPTSVFEAGCTIINSSMGRYSYCGYDCTFINADIGAFCAIAGNVSIGYIDHPMNWVGMSSVFYARRDSIRKKFSLHSTREAKRTLIGNDVWIGEKALIKAGITVGNGAVIGMGSIVTKNVPDYAIVAGNPAREVRKRFDEATIEALLKIQWWDFEDEKLEKYAQYITDPAKFIEEVTQT